MTSDDNLAAAKQAALLALAAEVTLPQDSGPAVKRRPTNRPRRRRRKLSAKSARPNPPPSPTPVPLSSPAFEYELEPVDHIVKEADVSTHDKAQVIDILNRFVSRVDVYPDHDDTLDPEHEPDERPAISAKRSAPHLSTDEHEHVDHVNKRPKLANQHAVNSPRQTEHAVEDDDDGDAAPVISRKQRKEDRRNLISRLKAVAPNPSLVEAWDVSAADPVLVTTLKNVRNSVTVPSNWRQKRKYLQNKRGLEKTTLQLPDFIIATGVGSVRDAQREADAKKTLKQKQRERMRAKTGSAAVIEVDDARLHDAFFKFQTKPHLSALGDVYYELRELEVHARDFRPGAISTHLRKALALSDDDPFPWLVGMQRWGPPPGWPGLRVAGVTAPIPGAARFGYQPGGWGKVPVDADGRPVYGDVFAEGSRYDGRRDRRFDNANDFVAWRWGCPRDDLGLLEGREGVATEQGGAAAEQSGAAGEGEAAGTDADKSEQGVADGGAVKKTIGRGESGGSTGGRGDGDGERSAYRVLPERKAWASGEGMMGSSHVYDVNVAGASNVQAGEKNGGGNDDVAGGEEGSKEKWQSRTDDKNRFKF